jgi:hypothetical protein
MEQDDLLPCISIAADTHNPMECFVWLDEASVDDETNISDLRLATSLSTMCTLQGLVCGKCFSFLPALCSKGTIELDAFEGSMNKE